MDTSHCASAVRMRSSNMFDIAVQTNNKLPFSNSLIIHMVISQSDCPILVRCMYHDTQRKSSSRLLQLVQKLMKTLIKTLANSITMQLIIHYRTSKNYSQRLVEITILESSLVERSIK